ncbi:hypothetical protein [Bergeyella zoohelcum]|uniref:Uncharacterized protein n=1 Tax=Bergeyella zoohelcum TaxID=1015 RepID=A0A376C2U2_9FLAO|nr:hypothetical protein [Bergeyella zoohelcum]EKB58242.1 hypothetical protein HMPREF9700_02050 [Bergeyella zoohelcum CCUG 30536]SSZ55815.1 Uncharacterised protein [Bergeyella zoohelcum]
MSTFFNQANAQKISLEQAKLYLEAFQKSIEIPKEYQFHSVEKVKIDKVSAYLFRYEKAENKGMRGEHFSFLVQESDKTILGFINMDKKYANTNLPTKEKTKEISQKFLQKVDAKLAGELKNQWIDRHDDIILVNGEETTLAVMKYKCYRPSKDDYAWVYVGFDGSVKAFERNTKWNMLKRQRHAEQWLHDVWRIKNNK